MADAPLELRITATDLTSRGINSVNNGLKTIGASAFRLRNVLGSLGVAVSGAALVGFLKSSINEASRAEAQFESLRKILESTGRSAQIPAESILRFAENLSKTTTASQGSIIEVAKVLSRFREITNESFQPAIIATLNLAKAMGTDAASAAQTLGRALNNPALAVRSLGGQMFGLTATQIKVIQGFAKMGDIMGANTALIKALNEQLGNQIGIRTFADRAARASNAFGELKQRIGELVTTSTTFNAFLTVIAARIDRIFKDPQLFAAFQAGINKVFLTVVSGVSAAIEKFAALTEEAGGFLKKLNEIIARMNFFNNIGGASGLETSGQLPSAVTAGIGSPEELDEFIRMMKEAREAGVDLEGFVSRFRAENEGARENFANTMTRLFTFGAGAEELKNKFAKEVQELIENASKQVKTEASAAAIVKSYFSDLEKSVAEEEERSAKVLADATMRAFAVAAAANIGTGQPLIGPNMPVPESILLLPERVLPEETLRRVQALTEKTTALQGTLRTLSIPEGFARQSAEIEETFRVSVENAKNLDTIEEQTAATQAAVTQQLISRKLLQEKITDSLRKSSDAARELNNQLSTLGITNAFEQQMAQIQLTFEAEIEQAKRLGDAVSRKGAEDLAKLKEEYAIKKLLLSTDEDRREVIKQSMLDSMDPKLDATRIFQQQVTANDIFMERLTKAQGDPAAVGASTEAFAKMMARINESRTSAGQLFTLFQTTGAQAIENFGKGVADAFMGFLTGTKDATEAFKALISSILAGIAQAIVQGLVLLALKNALNSSGNTTLMALGGLIGGAAAKGGVTTGPQLTLVGDNPSGKEMIVPLERANDMGFGGSSVNITVNVASDGTSKVEREGQQGGRDLGRLIEQSVMGVIRREKRPGGQLAAVG